MRCMEVGQDKLCGSNFASPNGNHVFVCMCACIFLLFLAVVFFGYYFCRFVLYYFLCFFT